MLIVVVGSILPVYKELHTKGYEEFYPKRYKNSITDFLIKAIKK